MQSEFACHIGLNGKYFCRICYVCNPTAEGETLNNLVPNNSVKGNSATEITDDEGNRSEANEGSVDQQLVDAENHPRNSEAARGTRKKSQGKKGKNVRKKKAEETLAQIVSRAQDFLTVRLSLTPT